MIDAITVSKYECLKMRTTDYSRLFAETATVG